MAEINKWNRGSMYFAPKTASNIFHMIILGFRTRWISFGEIKIMEVKRNLQTGADRDSTALWRAVG